MASVATAGTGEGGSVNRKNLDKARLEGWVPGKEVRSNNPQFRTSDWNHPMRERITLKRMNYAASEIEGKMKDAEKFPGF